MYLTFTRKGIVALTAFFLMVTAMCAEFSVMGSAPQNGSTNARRVGFIGALGVEVIEECSETSQIKIPAKFSSVYEGYNELQKQAGYDLKLYSGCSVTRYTYILKDKPETRVNLLIYKGRIIGGDISDVSLGGSMLPLKKQE